MFGLQIFVVSYLTCAAAFLAMTVLVVARGTRTRYRWRLVAATAATAAWAALVAARGWPELAVADAPVALFEMVRNLAWLVFLAALLGLEPARRRARRALGLAIATPAAALLALGLVQGLDPALLAPGRAVQLAAIA
ncbi:MAG: hypothetical protein V3S45_07765, partial [Kiloniellales bacterium]